MIESEAGHISVGWLIVEDMVMILAIVLLPTLAEILSQGAGTAVETAARQSTSEILASIGITLGKAIAFVAVMLLVGQRVIPWILHYIAHTGSRELFRLGILALALGVAYGAAELVGVSFALGAFFAGLVLSESELSQRAAAEALPLRDAFAVLFFVSVGMLFDPAIFLREPWPILGTVLIVTMVKPAAAFFMMRVYRYPLATALTVAASRTQIGEFSFILAGLGVGLGLLPGEGRDLVLAGAMLSIVATPAFFLALDRAKPWVTARAGVQASGPVDAPEAPPTTDLPATELTDHAIVVGFGRVGSVVCDTLQRQREPILVIEERPDYADRARKLGIEVLFSHAPTPGLTEAANFAGARRLFIAIPESFEAGQIAEQARAVNTDLQIIARAHSDAEADHLRKYGADAAIMGERELANAMLARAFGRLDPGAGGTGSGADNVGVETSAPKRSSEN